MGTKKAVAAGAALAAAGFIGAGMAQAAPLDAFVLGGPSTISADVIGAGSYTSCTLAADVAPIATKTLVVATKATNGSNYFRIRTAAKPGVYYVDVTCSTPGAKIVKKNFVVSVF